MPFEIVRNDITNMKVDAAVNTASPSPVIGTGVDTAINKKAGPELLIARKEVGRIELGQAAITPGFALNAKYVIHTAGPIWEGGMRNEEQKLASCYRNSLVLAKKNSCCSIAFPLISTGNYGFPKPLALEIAVHEISSFLLDNDMQVYLVVFEKESFELSEKLFNSVREYIDENYVEEQVCYEYVVAAEIPQGLGRSLRRREFVYGNQLEDSSEIEELLGNLDAGFSETLLKLIDKSGKKDSEIYKKANIDRRLFSKIRNNKDYNPSKTTALAFAFALELDLDETEDFIARAGYALSNSSKFDVIVEYFLENENYNVFELNEVLFAFDQPLLGV